MNMYSLDTNVLLRFLLDDIPEQTKKAKKIITSSRCYVTDVVITEAVFVLERVIEMKRSDIAKLVGKFLALPNIVYNDYFLDEVFDMYKAKPKLSFVDCYAAVEASVYENKLFTFDDNLAKHGGKHVKKL